MQIKTISNGIASLRRVTLGHAVRILVTEVLQAEGVLDYCRAGNGPNHNSLFECRVAGVTPDVFCFVTSETDQEYSGNKEEVERFLTIVDLALKAGATRAEKFDPLSQRLWMCSVLHGYEADSFHLARDYRSRSLAELADEIDKIINRHGLVTFAEPDPLTLCRITRATAPS
jgi:hypothetical protein